MNFSTFNGMMVRRLLVNWRIDAAEAAAVLPGALRPSLVNGNAVAGLCLVRLKQLRPAGLPAALGLSSENVAIRMGVEFDTAHGVHKSVMIFRRESASRLNGILCPLIGYGVHHRATIVARDSAAGSRVEMVSAAASLHAQVRPAEAIRRGSAFRSMGAAEDFFRGSECGYSPTRVPGVYDGARLHLHRWDLWPMTIESAHSTFLTSLFPNAVLDSAFVMRDIEHTWSACGRREFGPFRRRMPGAAVAAAVAA